MSIRLIWIDSFKSGRDSNAFEVLGVIDSLVYVESSDRLWASYQDPDTGANAIAVIDPYSMQILSLISMAAAIWSPMIYDPINDAVWAYSGAGDGNSLFRLNGRAETLSNTFSIANMQAITPNLTGGVGVIVGSIGNMTFQLRNDSGSVTDTYTPGASIYGAIGLPTGWSPAGTYTTDSNTWFAFDTLRNHLLQGVSASGTTTITVKASDGSTVATYSLAAQPSTAACFKYDHYRDAIWISQAPAHKVVGIKAADGTAFDTMTDSSMAPAALAISPFALYASDNNGYAIDRFAL